MSALVASQLESLLGAFPLQSMMTELVPSGPKAGEPALVAGAMAESVPPPLQAAIWLYVDDLNRSHNVSQGIESEEGAFWHGIMHRREGDFSNAKYWFRRAGSLPTRLGLDPTALTDEVASHFRDNPPHLVDAQRREWIMLVEHCARQAE
ncbi:hypothetical protein [Fimbriimonas ginsengisoli]|uniref:Uncharacterized protein n=1 Tax=Fimbriimonas ginsengisoli Gsoil 348 TaxID=661478 RepID=A0A068NK93_FIMGI|nr:hypothetical protein [Fimbriimonas ginsengisoli]AIE83916.1 hypothetical protein OP10G_0548 [Fimbriimonas ginsengisoli Gsoil 348]